MARERIEQGKLPCAESMRTWEAFGSGLPCALCSRPITPAQIEYEVECSVAGEAQTFRFHLDCQHAWNIECERLKS